MLSSAKTDASSTEADRVVRFFRSIGVGEDFDSGIFISPVEDLDEVLVIATLFGFNRTILDGTGGTVDGDDIAFVIDMST